MKSNLITFDMLDSTNNEAQRIIAAGSVSGEFIVSAGFQQHGRGQSANRWVSDPGRNLLMSWVVYPAFLSVNQQFQLSKAVSLAITDLFASYFVPCCIKWPNDIVCDSGKIGGILIENSILGEDIRHSIIGIGLNINQMEFPPFPRPATSMINETGKNYDPEEVRDSLISFLNKRYKQLEGGEQQMIDTSYLLQLFRINEVSVFTDGVNEFEGVISGVNEIGELQLMREGKLYSHGFHEIKMI